MSKTKKLFFVLLVMFVMAVIVAGYGLGKLYEKEEGFKDFKLVDSQDGKWNEDVIQNLKFQVSYDIENDSNTTEASFTYMNGEVTDIKLTEKPKEEESLWMTDNDYEDECGWVSYHTYEGEVIHGNYINDGKAYVVVSMTTSKNGYVIYVYIIDAEKGSMLVEDKYAVELDEEIINENNALEQEKTTWSGELTLDEVAEKCVATNVISDKYILLTVTQICGHQDMIKIDFIENEKDEITNLEYTQIDHGFDGNEYMSSMISSVESEDGTLYVCYLEGVSGALPEFNEHWKRRIISCGYYLDFSFKGNGYLFRNKDNASTDTFNGVAVRAYKKDSSEWKLTYWGHFESGISQLFSESIKSAKKGYSMKYEGTDLEGIKMTLVN